jgi:hypothetical protein
MPDKAAVCPCSIANKRVKAVTDASLQRFCISKRRNYRVGAITCHRGVERMAISLDIAQ